MRLNNKKTLQFTSTAFYLFEKFHCAEEDLFVCAQKSGFASCTLHLKLSFLSPPLSRSLRGIM